MSRKTALYKFAILLGIGAGLPVLAASCATQEPAGDEHVATADSELTAAQCLYFDVKGKDQICHYTGSGSHPYTIIKTSDQGCINGHAGHAHDYIAVGDPTCQGGGCLPVNAPCDATLPCCNGSTCQSGTCTQVNHCAPNPCAHGTCTNGASSYTCQCQPGYTGANCDVNVDECASSPCVHGACVDQVNTYVCDCQPGYTGDNCEINLDECASEPCVHGSCEDQVNAYVCDCAPGYVGSDCSSEIDECESNPCVHGVCVDQVNSYTCDCDEGYTGTNCETSSDLCAGVSCAALDQCHVAGVCDMLTGQCSNPVAPDTTACNDGNALTYNDVCTAGACAGTSVSAAVCPCGTNPAFIAGLDDFTSCATGSLITTGTWSGGTIGSEDPAGKTNYCYSNTGGLTSKTAVTLAQYNACSQIIAQAATARGVTCCATGLSGPACDVPVCPCAEAPRFLEMSTGATTALNCTLINGEREMLTTGNVTLYARPTSCTDGFGYTYNGMTAAQATACTTLVNQFAANAGITCH